MTKKTFGTQRKISKRSALTYRSCVTLLSAIAASLFLLLPCFSFDRTTAHADVGQSVVKAGVFGFEGYHMKDDDGRLTGYGISFLNLVSEYSRLNFQFVGYEKSWDDMQDMLDKHEIDVVTSASKTAEREEKYDFSLPIGRKQTILSIQVDNTERQRGNYSTYNGMVVGQIPGTSQIQLLADFAEAKGFEYETREYEKDYELAAALQRGEIDAILSSDLRKAQDEKTLDIIAESDFYAIVRKGESDLLGEINYAIEQMDINEGDWQNELYYKYYGPVYSSALSFTERETEYIRQVVAREKSITVTAYGERAPYSYTENGELKGIMPDYFAEVMKFAKLPYTLVAPESNDDYNRLVGTNGVNVVLDSVGSDDTASATGYHGFNTDSYMTASIAMVTRHDLNGDIKVVAVSAAQGKDFIDDGFLEGYTVETYPTGEEAMLAVLNRQADAAYVYAYNAQWYINKNHIDSLYYSTLNGMSTSFSMYISANTDHELITILNKCIKQTSDDTLNRLALKYTSYEGGDAVMSFGDYLLSHPHIIIIAVVVLFLVASVILTLFLRGRWNRRLLTATEESNRKMSEQLAIVEGLSRDYINVYTVNEDRATARVIKMEGLVTEELQTNSIKEYDYSATIESYIGSHVHPDDRQELSEALSLEAIKSKLSGNTEYNGNFRVVDNDEIHYFQFTFIKISDKDYGIGDFILMGFRNVDEVISKEQEQKVALSEALAEAQSANKAKTRFLNSMSHDIRTPMNAIIGFTSLAVNHIDNKDRVLNYLGKIMTSGNHLLSLINDVLDMSRIESGKVVIDEKETHLPDVLRDLKTIVQTDVKTKQLHFSIDTLDVTNETVICDRLRLNQILLNILSNAIKYTKSGGTIGVRVAQTSEATDGVASYEFRIKDNGIGMSREFLKHVFEPFEREQTSTVSGIQGTGLGLSITKNLVDMMGGTITVESEVGKGSEFTLRFTFRIPDSGVRQKLSQLENVRALIVHGNESTCADIGKILSAVGARLVDVSTSGKEAVKLTKLAIKEKEPYGIFIIDSQLPDMSGVELVRRIHKNASNTDPVILLTAYDPSDIVEEANTAGVTALLSKPLFVSELRSILATLLFTEETKTADKADELKKQVFTGKKLLLVEDNELNMEIAQEILETEGFIVDTANDGTVAVEKMKENPSGTYDLILMDVQMPIMNGYQATKEIRALDDPAKASIPIVAMTANAFEEDRKEALDAGMNGFAAKPIEVDKLLDTLQELLP